jgi:NAD(P)-dependent dehydrogenase (short-subunit alcohol dehydrogenase family)
MAHSIPYGARSTADQVLAGIDLTRKRIVVTGCSSGIGFETMNALVANGAHVIGLARTRDSAQAACNSAGPSSTPIACDMTDLESVEAAADSILRLPAPRGVSVNSLHPGATRGTGFDKYRNLTRRLSHRVARLFMKSPARGAATQALLAASPQVGGITGEYWSDCQIAQGNPLLADAGLTGRLWEASEQIVSSIRSPA